MRKLCLLFAVLFLLPPHCAHADVLVVEGDAAKKLYATEKDKVQTLVQKDKEFLLRTADGTEVSKPEKITVKVGERIYVTNEEMEIVHNVYDSTDTSWLLKKQEASSVAAITFLKAGQHKLRCAIHPIMKTEVVVVP